MDIWPTDWNPDLAQRVADNTHRVLGGLGLGQLAVAALYAGSFLLLALLAWLLFYPESRGPRRGIAGRFLGFLFPRSVYGNRSSWVDVQLIIINQIVSPLSLALSVTLASLLAALTAGGLHRLLGWDPVFDWNAGSLLGFSLCLALVADLATYTVHRLHHTVPWLWEFHKVHHSAEVLSPLTVFRKHPVFDLLNRLLKGVLLGPLQGVVFFLFAGPVDALTVLGVNLVFGLFHMAGAALRHSHVWLSYGPVLEHVLISPAQHQIHHSRARRHWDRNFGQVFALWDWLFGTLYVPKGREELEFGLDDTPATAHAGLVGGCLRPFANAARVWRDRRERHRPATAAAPAEFSGRM